MANPNHDARGEFTFGTGSGKSHAIVANAYQFYSPNEKEGLSFEDARAQLDSKNQAAFIEISKDVDRQVGLDATPHSAVGDWSDGAENSVFNEIRSPTSFDTVAYSAAIKGDIANQKAVIPFVADPKGADTVYRMDLPGKLTDIRSNLESAGLHFRTIVPTDTGAHVVLYDPGSALRGSVEKLGEHYENLTVTTIRGRGEFLGGDTREEGHTAYGKVIASYEQGHVQGRYKRPDSAATDRIAATAKVVVSINAAVKAAIGQALAKPDISRQLRKLRKAA